MAPSGGSKCQNYLNKISEFDVDRFISPLCDDALEELLIGPNGQFKANEEAATLKGKLRSDCRDFKRLSLPYEHLMLQGVNLVDDVVRKNISYEVGQRLAKDVCTTFSKFKSKDDSYEKSKKRGVALKRRCSVCITKYNHYIKKVNLLGLGSNVEDMILCHYLSISVIPVLDLYRDIVTSYEKLMESYETSIQFFKSDGESDDQSSRSSSYAQLQVEGIINDSICRNSNSNKESKNTFFSLAPLIFGIGTLLVAAMIIKKNLF